MGIEGLKLKEIENILIEYLSNEEIVGGEKNYMKFGILKSLYTYKDPDLLYIFEENLNDKDKDIRYVCKKAIDNINKVIEKKQMIKEHLCALFI